MDPTSTSDKHGSAADPGMVSAAPDSPARAQLDGIEGYATHTGEARSTADVTVRDGVAPIQQRGEGAGEAIEEGVADSIPSSSNAPA